MKIEDKLMFMEFAEAAARRSQAVRLKVGCILVKDGEVLSTGLNGMPPKWPTETCEDRQYFNPATVVSISKTWLDTLYPYCDSLGSYKLITKSECRHAEIAALEKMWKSHNTTEGAECFVTASPCKNCSIKLLTAGIKSVYYRHDYRDSSGISYLRDNGVTVEQI